MSKYYKENTHTEAENEEAIIDKPVKESNESVKVTKGSVTVFRKGKELEQALKDGWVKS